MNLKINPESNIPKYQQIADSLTGFIEAGVLKVGEKLPSINVISRDNNVAKETVVLAYKLLRSNGIIDSNEKKGFYVQTSVTEKRWRVLVLFNIMSPSKELIYNSILNTLQDKAHVELFFHYYNLEVFENLIRSKAGMFHYFIVMPHNDPRSGEIMKAIAPEKLIIIDRPLLHHVEGASSVHQDFKKDVYEALHSQIEKCQKYNKIIVLFPKNRNLPDKITEGIKLFGKKAGIPVSTFESPDRKMLAPGVLFITLTDDQLINLIELQQQTNLKLGKGIGIISYNDSPLKRILAGGIATLSSDFERMGKTVASCIIDKTIRVERNPFYFVTRNSL